MFPVGSSKIFGTENLENKTVAVFNSLSKEVQQIEKTLEHKQRTRIGKADSEVREIKDGNSLDISGNATKYLGIRSRGWRGSKRGMGKSDDEGQKAQGIKQSPIPRQQNLKMVQTHMSSTCSNKSEMRSFTHQL